MIRKLLLLAAIALLVRYASAAEKKCGVERWPVKTLADLGAPADLLQNAPRVVDLAFLVAQPAPSRIELEHATSTRFPLEHEQFYLRATLKCFKLEGDRDFHLVLEDAGETMVAEIPSPACTKDAQLEATWTSLRRAIEQRFGRATAKCRPVNAPVAVTGVFFFDFLHGQTGVAPNGAELHPVMDLTFQSDTGVAHNGEKSERRATRQRSQSRSEKKTADRRKPAEADTPANFAR